jgi:hypothetical protein
MKLALKILVISKHQFALAFSFIILKLTYFILVITFIQEPEISNFVHIAMIESLLQLLRLLIVHSTKTLPNIMIPMSIINDLFLIVKEFAFAFYVAFLPIANIFPTTWIYNAALTVS